MVVEREVCGGIVLLSETGQVRFVLDCRGNRGGENFQGLVCTGAWLFEPAFLAFF